MIRPKRETSTDNGFLPFSRPSISEQEIQQVIDVLRSGWITTGPKATEFERRFCERVGCQHAIALSSATAGMHLLLHAMDIGPGDEVITPSLTWVSTVNMIVARGATPVLVDVDRDTLMTTADLIEPHISRRTRLIVPIHFAGAALDLDKIQGLSVARGIPLVEDTAHAIGSAYKNRMIGQQGTAIFSFHPIKNLTTAEGGMFCTDDKSLAERIRRLKFHGLGVDAFDRETQQRAPQAEVLEPGFKYNLPDMNAALGIGQLARLEVMDRKRTALAADYQNQLDAVDEIEPLGLPDYPMQHSWHLFVVRLNVERTGLERDAFMDALREKRIGTGLHFRAVHSQKYYRDHMPLLPEGGLPNTEWNSERILSLPLFPDMRQEDVSRVVAAIKSILTRIKTK